MIWSIKGLKVSYLGVILINKIRNDEEIKRNTQPNKSWYDWYFRTKEIYTTATAITVIVDLITSVPGMTFVNNRLLYTEI